MNKMISLLLCVILLAPALGGCKSSSSSKAIRMDISGPVENLDPQFATDPTARMILGNLYEGLVIQGADGEILPGAAEAYTLSDDLCTYIFTLRQDGLWSDDTPVTAADFVFAFQRLFSSGSPYAGFYSTMENAAEILSGKLESSRLGIRAADDTTLIITLSRPDPSFLQRLCDPAAAPCNKDLFDGARGRYGLEPGFVSANGPFYLYKWDNTKNITLLPNESYRQPVGTEGVVFYIGQNASKQFQDGKTDLAFLSYDQQEGLQAERAIVTPIQKTVWCIVFNQDHSVWGNPLLRQGLSYTVDHQLMGGNQPPSFTSTSVLVPDAVGLMGHSYRRYAFAESPLTYNTTQGRRLFEMGLSALGRDQLPSAATIYFPEAAAESLNLGELQQGWQKYLSAYIKFEVATAADIESRFRTGDYQMLLMPFTPSSPEVSTLLGMFSSSSSQNYFGYRNPVYDELLADAKVQPTLEQAARKYAQAETMLLSDAVVIPLYFETSYLAVSSKVTGLQVSPFGDSIHFKDAVKQ